MILLPQQFQALVYHFLSGWVFALTWSGMNRLSWHYRKTVLRWILETLYFFAFVTLMFWGLIPINGGQTQIYLLAAFAAGTLIYLKFYAMTFSPLFERIVMGVCGLLKTGQAAWDKNQKRQAAARKKKADRKKAEKQKKKATQDKKRQAKAEAAEKAGKKKRRRRPQSSKEDEKPS